MIRFTASDFYTYYRPARCGLRLYLKERGEEESAPSPYQEVLIRLGIRHERTHLETFPKIADLSTEHEQERKRRTIEEVQTRSPAIYQPTLQASASVRGVECEIVGEPDFFVANGDEYFIRDSKVSRRINEDDHPEILRQMELYGWLYEQTFGSAPAGLQVHSGTGDIVDLPYDGGVSALEALEEIASFRLAEVSPYDAVLWSKCGPCGFFELCWREAEDRRDVALIPGVDQGLAKALRDDGVETFEQLLARFDEDSLAEFQRPWGKGQRRVGTSAPAILTMARAMANDEEIILMKPDLPVAANWVMFDVEGLPPQLDELDKIYLWGFQVFGDEPGEYQAAMAGFGPEGDREGWEDFLIRSRKIFESYGDIRFVHWTAYEKGRLTRYIDRFGDCDGIAERVRANLLDLYPITQKSVALPLPSYSLKVVERYVGFERTQEEYGGDWSMARYIEATETEDEALRAEVMDEILEYNREDLEATWAVLQWLQTKV